MVRLWLCANGLQHLLRALLVGLLLRGLCALELSAKRLGQAVLAFKVVDRLFHDVRLQARR